MGAYLATVGYYDYLERKERVRSVRLDNEMKKVILNREKLASRRVLKKYLIYDVKNEGS